MEEKEPKKKWVFIEEEETDKIKNRPEWANEKDREELVFEPHSSPLEDWLKQEGHW